MQTGMTLVLAAAVTMAVREVPQHVFEKKQTMLIMVVVAGSFLVSLGVSAISVLMLGRRMAVVAMRRKR